MKARDDKHEYERMSLLLSTVERAANEPDRQFLDKLRKQSTNEFLTSSGGNNKESERTILISIWRTIMKSRRSKLTAAAAIVMVAAFGISTLEKLTAPAWAIEQTVRALKNIKTIAISGTTVYHDSNDVPEYKPFKCWIKLNDKDGNLLMRAESPRELAVVQGDKVYFQEPGSNTVEILEGQSINNLKFWYKVMELSPWLSGKMLQILRPLADDWQEEYGTYEKTGRDCVFVNCSYEQLSASFWFVFDVESKLIIEARHWSNPDYKEPVNSYADSFVYNEEIPDETFQFEIPEGAEVIHQKDVDRKEKLLEDGIALFKDGKYAEALDVFKKADDPFMVGICYMNVGEYEKAAQSLKDETDRQDEPGSLSATYFYLGSAYMEIGQKDNAIQAFENCLESGRGFLDTEGFPMKNVRKWVEKLKRQN